MPRPAKPARLVWRDKMSETKAGWFIAFRGKRYPTGCAKGEIVEAQRKLANWIAEQYKPERVKGRTPDSVKVADAVSVYIDEVAHKHAAPKETMARLFAINEFFGEHTIAEIDDALCDAYKAQAPRKVAAVRQLEDLRSALNHYQKRGFVTMVPKIPIPTKSDARHRWLTRDEAARLLFAAWRMRQSWKGQDSDRRTGRHVARFILVALYTGTRSAAVCGAAVRPIAGRGYVDLGGGYFYRRAEDAVETKKRQTTCLLPDRLLIHLRRWAVTPVEIKTKARGKSVSIGRMISEDYVVEWAGKPVKSIKKAFRSAVEAAKLGTYDANGKFQTDVTPHTLRHTAATWLMMQGLTLTEAGDYLGMTEATLRKHYYHAHPDFQAAAAHAITAKPAARKKSNVVRLYA